MFPRTTIVRAYLSATITETVRRATIINTDGPYSPFPQLKFTMTPWGLGSVGEGNVLDIETRQYSAYPQGRAGFNTLYCPVMGEGQGDLTGTVPPVNPSWCVFPALYDADPTQDVPVTPTEATTRGLPQSVVRPTQSLLATRPKMRGWVEIDEDGPAAWVSAMASEFALWVERFVEPISPGGDATQYAGPVLINWERLKAFTFDFNRIGTSGDASWICYRQWRQLQTGGTGTLASPWTSVTGGTETEQQSRERFRTLVRNFFVEVLAAMRVYLPQAHIAWWNEPSPQNWYQLDPLDTTVWNAAPVATIDGTPMKRYEAIRYETLGWMAEDIYPLFDSIHAQVYDFIPPANADGSSAKYGTWESPRPTNDVNVTHITVANKTYLSSLYLDLMEDLRVLTGLPCVGWLASVSYFSQTTGYRILPTDLQIYTDLLEQYAPNWSIGIWIDCLNYGWDNATLGNLTNTRRWEEVRAGLVTLNPVVATLTGDAGNGDAAVDFPAPAIPGLPPLVGPTYSGLTASEA